MLGIIAWIRPDGRKALVVVAGSDQMASGDPGQTTEESLKVGDLVYMPALTQDMSDFRTGLQLVRSAYWPHIVRDIGVMATQTTDRPQASNVVDLFAPRSTAAKPKTAHGRPGLSLMVAAE